MTASRSQVFGSGDWTNAQPTLPPHFHVWTDGSCVHLPERQVGGAGGWSAVIESELLASVREISGCEPNASSTKMELRAAIEGLRALAGGCRVMLHVDCTAVLDACRVRSRNSPDKQLRKALACEIAERQVRIELVRRNKHIHSQRAHQLALSEARNLCQRLYEQGQTSLHSPPSTSKVATRLRQELLRRGLRHHPGCTSGRCVTACDIWQALGYPLAL